MDHTVLTGSCGPTQVLTVHGIKKKLGFLGLKTGFHSGFRFSRSDLPVQSGSENHGANTAAHALARYAKDLLEDIVWIEDSPPPAEEALYLDSISI